MESLVDLLLPFAHALLIVILIKVTLKILGSELHHFMEALRSEIKEASSRAKTVGAINWYQFITVAVVGILIIVASTGQKLLGISLAGIIGAERAKDLARYSDYTSLLFVLAILMVISLVCVVIDNRRRGDK
jgi:hypothetical protein